MTDSHQPPPHADAVYIRATTGPQVSGTRVATLIAWCAAAALAAVAVFAAIGAAHEDATNADLVAHGVPVEVTVTSCEGVSSGIGQAISFYLCRGQYRLDGRSYSEVIGGSRSLHVPGQVLPAVAVPEHPGELALPSEVARHSSSLTPFAAPIVLGAGAVATGALGIWVSRRRRSTGA